MQLTVCNRKPPILFLHLEIRMALALRILFLIHLLVVVFARLRFGVHLRLLRWRGRRHYEWSGYVRRVVTLGVKAWLVCWQTTSDSRGGWCAVESGFVRQLRVAELEQGVVMTG